MDRSEYGMTFQKGNKYGIKKGEKLWKLRDPNNPNLVRTQFKKGYSNIARPKPFDYC